MRGLRSYSNAIDRVRSREDGDSDDAGGGAAIRAATTTTRQGRDCQMSYSPNRAFQTGMQVRIMKKGTDE